MKGELCGIMNVSLCDALSRWTLKGCGLESCRLHAALINVHLRALTLKVEEHSRPMNTSQAIYYKAYENHKQSFKYSHT